MMAMAVTKERPGAEGLLPGHAITALHERGVIRGPVFEPGQVQPASLDLRLGRHAWRVRASFLPSTQTSIEERLANFSLHRFELDPEPEGLEQGCLSPLHPAEPFKLPPHLPPSTNPPT